MATYNVQVEDSEGNKYYPKPDLLTTKEQVSANTAAGKSVDALVVKQISSDISKAIGYIDYTSAADLSDIGTGATVTEDGVVRLIASRYTTGNFEPILYINNAVVWTENMAPYGSCGIQSQYFPVRQGDTVKATFSGCSSGRVEFCRFRN